MDSLNDRRVVVYARNAVFDIAKELGYRYFIVLDDDYSAFMFRWPEDGKLVHCDCRNLPKLFSDTFDFLDESGALAIAYAQGGDFIGGLENKNFHKHLLRKAMNVWFLDTEKRFEFIGRINEDTNTYVLLGTQGKLFFTVTDVMITQVQTQANAGGLTDIYLDKGTYVKSFYTVMAAPSCSKIATMGAQHRRIHHKINWKYCTPKILNEKWRKCNK